MCTLHICHLGGKNPPFLCFLIPRLFPPPKFKPPPPPFPFFPPPPPRQPFPSQANNECVRSISVTWGQKPHFHMTLSSWPLTTSNIELTHPIHPLHPSMIYFPVMSDIEHVCLVPTFSVLGLLPSLVPYIPTSTFTYLVYNTLYIP